ncbi:MAG: histidinol dehydrogenase [Actinobacteria bacterium RBG_13_35_12]|nr:MAG: histidinol dehydrogenase [Actinobacteria bacterium RBG_13_35_12]
MNYDFLKVEKPKTFEDVIALLATDLKISSSTERAVDKILKEVKVNGDRAILKFCKQFDCFEVKDIDDIRVKDKEINFALTNVKKEFPELVKALGVSYKNIKKYHTAQFRKGEGSWSIKPEKGKEVGQIIFPLERVGIYIPGGRYSYPSSLLMTAIPAIVAGVKEIIICTPPQPDGSLNQVLLYLCGKLKIKEVYKIGGAQAIAALAYGTKSIKKVDKIVGPGNIFVTTAKKKVFGDVGIDSLAGPSDITILADDSANPGFIAADLVSQAEHDPDSRSILLSDSKDTARRVIGKIYEYLDNLIKEYGSRVNIEIILKSLKKNCKIIFSKEKDRLIEICNMIAPEHLEIMVKDAKKVLKNIKNAGAIFIGEYCPVAVGDYIGGTNHVIPTNGNARFSSPLGVYDFLKRSSITFYSKDALKKEKRFIEIFSEFERLFAHKSSIKIRFKNDKDRK